MKGRQIIKYKNTSGLSSVFFVSEPFSDIKQKYTPAGSSIPTDNVQVKHFKQSSS